METETKGCFGRALALALLLVATVVLGVGAAERTERGTFRVIGSLTERDPGPDGTTIEIEAVALVPLKARAGGKCVYFRSDGRARTTTVRAVCFPNGDRTVPVQFEVQSIVWKGNSGFIVDRCVERKVIRRATNFACTVKNPALPRA